jgi:hypothetical protein
MRLFRHCRFQLISCARALTISCSLLVSACLEPGPPAGQIVVKNDSQDRSYNVITVSGSSGGRGSIKPGERFILPRGTKSFSVERRYRDFTRSYRVECPPLGERGIAIRLIDIHVNKIPAGCKTVYYSGP